MSAEKPTRRLQPIDVLVSDVDPRRAGGFVDTCVHVAEFIEASEPQAILYPSRGAAPMLHTIRGLDLLAEIPYFEPPIGSAMGNAGSVKGINSTRKLQILEQYLEPGMRVALVDESQNGGTLRQHRQLSWRIVEQDVITCQVQDDRITPVYAVGDSDTAKIFMGPVYHVDRDVFLDAITDVDGTRTVVRNEPAAVMFETLGASVYSPLSAEQLVGDQHPILVMPEQINDWVADFNAQGLSI